MGPDFLTEFEVDRLEERGKMRGKKRKREKMEKAGETGRQRRESGLGRASGVKRSKGLF